MTATKQKTKTAGKGKESKLNAIGGINPDAIYSAINTGDATSQSESLFAEQAKVNKTVEKANIVYQRLALSFMQHLAKHHDIRVIRRFFENMPKSLRVKSMQVFFDKYATIQFDDEGECHYDATKPLQFAAALENAWWLASPPEQYVPFNLDVEIQKLVARAAKKLETPKLNDDGTPKDSIDKDTFDALNLLATRKIQNVSITTNAGTSSVAPEQVKTAAQPATVKAA